MPADGLNRGFGDPIGVRVSAQCFEVPWIDDESPLRPVPLGTFLCELPQEFALFDVDKQAEEQRFGPAESLFGDDIDRCFHHRLKDAFTQIGQKADMADLPENFCSERFKRTQEEWSPA